MIVQGGSAGLGEQSQQLRNMAVPFRLNDELYVEGRRLDKESKWNPPPPGGQHRIESMDY